MGVSILLQVVARQQVMIIRQFCARHGRTALSPSTRTVTRSYVNSRNVDDPTLRQSERDPRPPRTIPGHPDEPSSILNTIDRPPTAATRSVEEKLEVQKKSMQSLHADVNSHIMARIQAFNEPAPLSTTEIKNKPAPLQAPESTDTLPFKNLKELNRYRRHTQKEARKGTNLTQTYDPATILRKPHTPRPRHTALESRQQQLHLRHKRRHSHHLAGRYIRVPPARCQGRPGSRPTRWHHLVCRHAQGHGRNHRELGETSGRLPHFPPVGSWLAHKRPADSRRVRRQGGRHPRQGPR